MKKFLAALLILAVVLAVVMEIVLPRIITGILEDQIVKATHAKDADLKLTSSPNVKIVIGDIDQVYGAAREGDIGDMEFQALTLDAENMSVDVMELLFPTKNISDQQHIDKILKSAGRIELSGIVTEDGLKKFIEQKVDQLDSAQIKITPQEVSATGQVKIMGNMADVDIAGSFILDDDDIYFHATKLNVRNALVRHVQMDRFLGDIKILQSSQLPIGLKFSSVKMNDGEVLITATR